MRLLFIALALAACSIAPTRWYESEDTRSQRPDLDWGVSVMLMDPVTTDASTVDDLHRVNKRAVCMVAGLADAEATLQLCQDKGFDAVSFGPGAVSEPLRALAEQLNLPVLTAPADIWDRRTTTGS